MNIYFEKEKEKGWSTGQLIKIQTPNITAILYLAIKTNQSTVDSDDLFIRSNSWHQIWVPLTLNVLTLPLSIFFESQTVSSAISASQICLLLSRIISLRNPNSLFNYFVRIGFLIRGHEYRRSSQHSAHRAQIPMYVVCICFYHCLIFNQFGYVQVISCLVSHKVHKL